MSELHLRPAERARPLIVVVCAVPMLGEAMESALDFAEVRSFSSQGGDIAGLLQWLRPDAVVVDDHAIAVAASGHAAAQSVPLVQISIRERSMRLYRGGAWEELADGDDPAPEAIRNVLAGALFAREGVR